MLNKYFVLVCTIVWCCSHANGDCHGYYTDSTVNSDPGIVKYYVSCITMFVCAVCVIAGYKDCKEWLQCGYTESGIYPINPCCKTPFQVSYI